MSLAGTSTEGGGPVGEHAGLSSPNSPSGPSDPPASSPRPRRRLRGWRRELAVLVGIALVITLLVRAFVLQAFYIPSASMQDTLHVGDRVLVSKLSYRFGDIHRGDVIVFDGTDSFAPEVAAPSGVLGRVARSVGAFFGMAPSEHDFVKRVIGLPGDSVVCCNAAGELVVDGVGVAEPYLYPGDRASAQTFDIVVPPGRLWVMGDHRSDSADSRSHLGDPGGGTVPQGRVIGKVVSIYWPIGRAGSLPHAPALARIPAGVGGTP